MKIATPRPLETTGVDVERPWRTRIKGDLRPWEIFFLPALVVVAGLLRMYSLRAGTTLDVDQTMIWRMARDAVTNGHLPATAGSTSIGSTFPPGTTYLMMIPAAFTADPFWGVVMQGILATVSVLLTYLFVRRYYGWPAGVIASLLYATSHRAVAYARYIWQPNLMPFFVIIYIWMLYRGVVERKKGWFIPAVMLAFFIIQLHFSALPLLAPLLVAMILAYSTLRWRDLLLGALGVVILFAPFLIWEIVVHFKDIITMLTASKGQAHLDKQVWQWYQLYISPYDGPSPDPRSLLAPLHRAFGWLLPAMEVCLAGGFVLAIAQVLWPGQELRQRSTSLPRWPLAWWKDLLASPERCGLLVLLAWELVPLILYTRHSVPLFRHYIMFMLPGQFILIGFFLSRVIRWLQMYGRMVRVGQGLVCAVVVMLVLCQGLGSLLADFDQVNGNFRDLYAGPLYHSDLASMEAAINTADRLAQEHHFNHVYVTTDVTNNGMGYLSEQMHTPSTAFDDTHCVVLPGPTAGPAIMLLGPHSTMTADLLTHYAHATLVAQPGHLGGPPYSIYIVYPDTQSWQPQGNFAQHLQLLNAPNQPMTSDNGRYEVTRWSFTRNAQPGFRKSYNYSMVATMNGQRSESRCTMNAIRTGDQLLVAFDVKDSAAGLDQMTVNTRYFEVSPRLFNTGPIVFDSGYNSSTRWETLHTGDGKDELTIPLT